MKDRDRKNKYSTIQQGAGSVALTLSSPHLLNALIFWRVNFSFAVMLRAFDLCGVVLG